MTAYGITTDYEYSSTHKRERLTIWSPPFFSVFEGDAEACPGRLWSPQDGSVTTLCVPPTVTALALYGYNRQAPQTGHC